MEAGSGGRGMVGVELERGRSRDEEERQRNGIVYSPIGEYAFYGETAFQGPASCPSWLPYKVPRHLPPHSEGGLIETEGGRVPFLKESTR